MATECAETQETSTPEVRALPWWTLVFTVAAAVVVSLLSRLATGYMGSADPDVLSDGRVYWRPWAVLTALESAAWSGLMFGLGLVLADRLGPRSWSRQWKWALGAAVLGALPSPSHGWIYLQGLLDGSIWHTWHMSLPYRAWLLVMGGFVGYWLARALQKRGSLWWRMPEAAIDAGLICFAASIPFWLLYNTVLNPTPDGAEGLLESGFYWQATAQNLVLTLVSGLLKGLALAAGMSRAVPLTQRTDIGEIASGIGANLKARVKWMFS